MLSILLQKETNRYLDWVKAVKESHGDFEANALEQAADINARGIYIVGKLKDQTDKVLILAINYTDGLDENEKLIDGG